jgi:hypothetical protein
MIVRPVSTVWTRLLSFILSLAVVLFAVAPALAATIQTDLWVYQQGDTVNVTGDGFDPSENVEIVTTDPNAVEVDRGTVLSDANGNIAYSFVLNSDVPGIYDVVATGLSSGLSASTQFDPAVATVTPSSKNYGSVAVGSTSAQVFTLQNTGTTVMNNIAVAISGADPSQFILNTSGTATSLASGASTTFEVTFTPTSIGAKSASATVDSNAQLDPVISLSGVGIAADTTAPQTTIDSSPANPSNDSTPTFSFSANEAGSTFRCQLDGGGFSACSSPASYGPLADGSHTFDVYATDPAGNPDLSPASYTWIIDTVAPQTTIDSSPANPSNDSTPTFSFSANEAGSTFRCRIDGGAYAACSSPATFALADGSHTFDVYATDPAGNPDLSPASYTWTIDATAPTVTITFPTAGSYTAFTWNAGCSSAFSGDFCGTASDPLGSGVNLVQYSVRRLSDGMYWNGTSFGSASELFYAPSGLNPWTQSWSYSNFPTAGDYTIRVRATDVAGNEGVAAVTFTINNPSGGLYTFEGFFSPIDNLLLNTASAGSGIPVRYRITLNGVPVSDPNSFVALTSRVVNCSTLTGIAVDDIETYSGTSGLIYSGDGNWHYNWKTPKNYGGQCRIMTLTLNDGSTHDADFKFR